MSLLQRRKPTEPGPGTYVYCEPVTASSLSRWHIRRITDRGLKQGGGADTKALCGREVSWDLYPVAQNVLAMQSSCRACVQAYEEAQTL